MEQKSVIYRVSKSKNPIISFLYYFRDCIIYYLPINKLPSFLRKLLYGDITYVFYIHPRRSQDLYLGLPFFSLLRKFLPKTKVLSIASKMPPGIAGSIKTEKGKGLVVSSLTLPELLMKERTESVKAAVKAIKFFKRISGQKLIVGLGAWWPIITRRGLSLIERIKDKDIIITNGHTGTVVSIYLMINKISQISGVPLSKLKVVIIGAGKMGLNVARVINGKVNSISFIDINQKSIDTTLMKLKAGSKQNATEISGHVNDGAVPLLEFLNGYHLGVCVTSNSNIVVKANELPDYFVVIDDSRPEAISRQWDNDNKIILEGGLMKIDNGITDYDYGFGIDQNVFGCLAETYALSLDNKGLLNSTVGDVDMNNFDRSLSFYKDHGINVGDFKTGDTLISEDRIIEYIKNRDKIIMGTKGGTK